MKHKKYYGYGAIGLTLAAIGVAFLSPLNTNNMLFRARATNVTAGTITFSGSNASKSGTTNTTICNSRVGGNIICRTYNNDSTQSSGRIGAMKTGSIMRFYESDGITEYTFQDLDIIRIEKTTGTNRAFDFTLHALYTDGTEFNQSYTTIATTDYKQLSFAKLKDVSNIWLECTSETGQLALITGVKITYNCSTKYLSGVSVTSSPSKTTYEEGESFDPSGMIVSAVYSDESTIATRSYTYYPTGPLSQSDTFITVSFGGFSTTQAITVTALPELTGLYVDTPPTKTTYQEGDSFDATGMVIKGTYSDGNDRIISGYTISPSSSLSQSDTFVTISYGGFSTTQAITVSAASQGPTGSYSYTYSSYVCTISFSGSTGTYSFKDWDSTVYSLTFSYSVSSSTVSITLISYASGSAASNFGNYRLFEGSKTSTTATYNSATDSMTITTYTSYGSSSNKTFTKVS